MSRWKTIKRPGYLGKNRTAAYDHWNIEYGSDDWRLVWKWKGEFLDFLHMCEVYEEAYLMYLVFAPEVLNELLSVATNVYDDAPSNVNSYLDYSIQETDRTHIQDIAIRRVVKSIGRKFEGTHLIRIRHDRGDQPLSMTLSPGVVPFHVPNEPAEILTPLLTGWWNPNTVECFYQSNRVLQVRS